MQCGPNHDPEKEFIVSENVVNNAENVGFLRLRDVLKIVPISRSAWWDGCKRGYYPAPVKLSPRTTAWVRSDILDLAQRLRDGTVSFDTMADDINGQGTVH